jgi:hypothetical protein
MSPLHPCPDCARHVRAADATCPFCGAALPGTHRDALSRPEPTRRLGRTALFALGAAAVATSIGVAGCSRDHGPSGGTDAGAAPDSGSATDGGPAEDAAPAIDAGFDAGLLAMYGGPPPPDDAGFDAGVMNLYGAPPAES